jgi:hypothetical protein
MASSRLPGLTRTNVPDPLLAGTLARWWPPSPGPLGIAPSSAGDAIGREGAPDTPAEIRAWIAMEIGSSDDDATVPSSTPTGMLRLARREESDANYRRLAFEDEAAARDAADRLAEHPVSARQLRELGGHFSVDLAAWTAERLRSGALKILWRRREPLSEAEPEAAPPPQPRRPAAPAPSSPPTPAYSTFPADLDAAAVANSLRAAAQQGVPFCEECMKAQAAAGAEPGGTT